MFFWNKYFLIKLISISTEVASTIKISFSCYFLLKLILNNLLIKSTIYSIEYLEKRVWIEDTVGTWFMLHNFFNLELLFSSSTTKDNL